MLTNSFLPDFLKKHNEAKEAPLYIYERQKIINNCKILRNIPYPNTSIHFASMANANENYIKIIKEQGLKIFVNSVPHLLLAEKTGYREKEIVYTASSIDPEQLKYLSEKNIYINLDSLSQLEYWQKSFPEKLVGIRCNIDQSTPLAKHTRAGYFIGENSRLGITTEEIRSIKNKEIINGLHIYVGTDILDIDYFLHFYELLINIAINFPNLEYLDLGGGFGIDENYQNRFDFSEYGKRVSELMERISKQMQRNIHMILEPGRIIGAEAGYFITKVIDIKQRSEKRIIIVNSSVTQFPRPLFYHDDGNHPVHIFSKEGKQKEKGKSNSMIVGCSTYSRDIFIEDIVLPDVTIGDFLVFGNAGSYCASSYTEFLGFNKPKELFI